MRYLAVLTGLLGVAAASPAASPSSNSMSRRDNDAEVEIINNLNKEQKIYMLGQVPGNGWRMVDTTGYLLRINEFNQQLGEKAIEKELVAKAITVPARSSKTIKFPRPFREGRFYTADSGMGLGIDWGQRRFRQPHSGPGTGEERTVWNFIEFQAPIDSLSANTPYQDLVGLTPLRVDIGNSVLPGLKSSCVTELCEDSDFSSNCVRRHNEPIRLHGLRGLASTDRFKDVCRKEKDKSDTIVVFYVNKMTITIG